MAKKHGIKNDIIDPPKIPAKVKKLEMLYKKHPTVHTNATNKKLPTTFLVVLIYSIFPRKTVLQGNMFRLAPQMIPINKKVLDMIIAVSELSFKGGLKINKSYFLL